MQTYSGNPVYKLRLFVIPAIPNAFGSRESFLKNDSPNAFGEWRKNDNCSTLYSHLSFPQAKRVGNPSQATIPDKPEWH